MVQCEKIKYLFCRKYAAGHLLVSLIYHCVFQISGCHNFSVDLQKYHDAAYNNHRTPWNTGLSMGGKLQVSASVTEQGTGAVVNGTHSGPGLTTTPLNVVIDDWTNGFFKPRLPYIGKVKVFFS